MKTANTFLGLGRGAALIAVGVIASMLGGCTHAAQEEPTAVEETSAPHGVPPVDADSTIRPTILPSQSVNNGCYWSGGVNWCQDFYSQKWCTSVRVVAAWDYTGCQWTGWKADLFCSTGVNDWSPGYQWGQVHYHCD